MGKHGDSSDKRSASAAHQDKLKARSDKQDLRHEEKRLALASDIVSSPGDVTLMWACDHHHLLTIHSLVPLAPKKGAKRAIREPLGDSLVCVADPPWVDIMSMLQELRAGQHDLRSTLSTRMDRMESGHEILCARVNSLADEMSSLRLVRPLTCTCQLPPSSLKPLRILLAVLLLKHPNLAPDQLHLPRVPCHGLHALLEQQSGTIQLTLELLPAKRSFTSVGFLHPEHTLSSNNGWRHTCRSLLWAHKYAPEENTMFACHYNLPLPTKRKTSLPDFARS
eukprot:1594733-Amphidinium_carterae.1